MDDRLTRFKFCDVKIYPYLKQVFERLPPEVADDVLNNAAFQILADADVLDKCTGCYRFDQPVETIVYLNIKLLMEPLHCSIHLIAHEIAHYILSKRKADFGEKEVEDLLISWGFEKEVHAVRYDKAVAQSKAYRTGYEWAKRQSQDYLMQHFGLYFDEWNEKGLGSMPAEGLDLLPGTAKTDSIIDEIMRLKDESYIEPEEEKIPEAFSQRKTMLAGVMAALKELKLSELCRPEDCASRRSAY